MFLITFILIFSLQLILFKFIFKRNNILLIVLNLFNIYFDPNAKTIAQFGSTGEQENDFCTYS